MVLTLFGVFMRNYEFFNVMERLKMSINIINHVITRKNAIFFD